MHYKNIQHSLFFIFLFVDGPFKYPVWAGVVKEQTCSWEMGVCFWLESSKRVHTSVRRSVLQPISRIRVLGQKSWISAFHCKNKQQRFLKKWHLYLKHNIYMCARVCLWVLKMYISAFHPGKKTYFFPWFFKETSVNLLCWSKHGFYKALT